MNDFGLHSVHPRGLFRTQLPGCSSGHTREQPTNPPQHGTKGCFIVTFRLRADAGTRTSCPRVGEPRSRGHAAPRGSVAVDGDGTPVAWCALRTALTWLVPTPDPTPKNA